MAPESVLQRAGSLRLIAARVRTGVADLELLRRQREEGARRIAGAGSDPITVSGAAAVLHSWYDEPTGVNLRRGGRA